MVEKIESLEQKLIQFVSKEPKIQQLDVLLIQIKQIKTKYDIEKQILEKMIAIFKKKQNSFSHVYSSAHLVSALFLKGILNIEELSIEKLLEFINLLDNFVRTLEGIPISSYIAHYMTQIINFLIESKEEKYKLDDDQKQKLKELLEDPKIKQVPILENKEIEKKLKEIEELVEQDDLDKKYEGAIKLNEIYTECESYDEQIILFCTKITEIVKKLVQNLSINDEQKKQKVKDILIKLGNMMETLVVNTEYQVELQRDKIKKNREQNPAGKQIEELIVEKEEIQDMEAYEKKRSENKMETDSIILAYRIVAHEVILRRSEDIYPSVAIIINSMLLFPQSFDLMQQCLTVLHLMLKLFPQYKDYIEDPILVVLQNINEFQTDEEKKKKAAMVAYSLLNAEIPSFKVREAFNMREKLSSLTSNKYYSKEYFKKIGFNNPEVHRFEQIILKPSFSLQKIVKPETGYSFNVEVKRAFSILYCGFATYHNDIKVRISKVLDFQDYEDSKILPRYYLEQKINSELEPHKILFLIEKPGVFKIEFDNTYSWLNEKQLRFRSCILEPEDADEEIKKTLEIDNQTKEDIQNEAKNQVRKFKEYLEEVRVQIIFRPNQIQLKLKTKVLNINKNYEFEKEEGKLIENLEKINKQIQEFIDEEIKQDLTKFRCYCQFIYNRELMEEFRDYMRKSEQLSDADYIQQIFEFLLNFWDSTVVVFDENNEFYDHFIKNNFPNQEEDSYIILKVNFKHKLMSAICYRKGIKANTKDYSLLLAGPNTAYKKAFMNAKDEKQGLQILKQMILNISKLTRNENKIANIIIWEEEIDNYLKKDEEEIKKWVKEIQEKEPLTILYISKNVQDLGTNIDATKDSEEEDNENLTEEQKEKKKKEEEEKQKKKFEEEKIKQRKERIEQEKKELREEEEEDSYNSDEI